MSPVCFMAKTLLRYWNYNTNNHFNILQANDQTLPASNQESSPIQRPTFLVWQVIFRYLINLVGFRIISYSVFFSS